MRKALLVLLLAWLSGLLRAEPQRFEFALPELEGRISLGVFDAQGRLVRTLCVGAKESDFTIGLNGLISTWDGADDAGGSLPAGKYRIRGYVVGEGLKTEGVAYHFNDWIIDEQSPKIARIEDFQRLPGGFLLLADVLDEKRQAAPCLLRFDEVRGFLWKTPLVFVPSGAPLRILSPVRFKATGPNTPAVDTIVLLPPPRFAPSPPLLAASADFALVLSESRCHVIQLSDGRIVNQEGCSGPPAAAMAAEKDGALVASGGGLTSFLLPGLDAQKHESTPISFQALAVEGKARLGGSAEKEGVWRFAQDSWTRLEIPALISSLSFGTEGTFWAVGHPADDSGVFLGQFDGSGEFLREYRSDFSPRKVGASRQIEEIAVLEEKGSSQRLRALQFSKKEEAVSEWEIVFEKTLEECSRFGLVEGKLVADAGNVRQNESMEIEPVPSGLTAKPAPVRVFVKPDPSGLWLAAESGVRLAFLASQPGVVRTVLAPAADRMSLSLYAGDGVVVAEYLVSGLTQIAPLDAGEIDLF